MYKQQTLIEILNFTKIINLFFKSDWLITMLFQGQQRNMSHLVKSGSAYWTVPYHAMEKHHLKLKPFLIHFKCVEKSSQCIIQIFSLCVSQKKTSLTGKKISD